MSTRIFKAAALAGISGAFAMSAFAGQLTVEINKTKPLTVSGQPSSIVLGNPAVADVTVTEANKLFVTGKAFGTTNLIIYNMDGRQIYSADVVVTTNSSNLVSVVRAGSAEVVDCSPNCGPVIGGQ